MNIHADCQESFGFIDKILIKPKNIYVGVPITFNDNTIRIINPSNLPINFEWENIFIPDDKIIEFSPITGKIPPRSFIEIHYKMTFNLSKKNILILN